MDTLQKSLVKFVVGALSIFIELQKEKFEIHTITQIAVYINAIVRKISCDISLKRHELIKLALGICFMYIINLQSYFWRQSDKACERPRSDK